MEDVKAPITFLISRPRDSANSIHSRSTASLTDKPPTEDTNMPHESCTFVVLSNSSLYIMGSRMYHINKP